MRFPHSRHNFFHPAYATEDLIDSWSASTESPSLKKIFTRFPIFFLQPAFPLLRLWVSAFRRPSFPEHPFPDIRRAAQHRDTLRLARVEKSNTFDIHEIQLLQIQIYSWSATLDLGFHLIKVLRSKLTA
jgi:hypothetical protein